MSIALITNLAKAIHLATRRNKARRELRALSDHLLRDIGIERHQIAAAVDQMITLEGGSPFETERRLEQAAAGLADTRSLPPVWKLPKAA